MVRHSFYTKKFKPCIYFNSGIRWWVLIDSQKQLNKYRFTMNFYLRAYFFFFSILTRRKTKTKLIKQYINWNWLINIHHQIPCFCLFFMSLIFPLASFGYDASLIRQKNTFFILPFLCESYFCKKYSFVQYKYCNIFYLIKPNIINEIILTLIT